MPKKTKLERWIEAQNLLSTRWKNQFLIYNDAEGNVIFLEHDEERSEVTKRPLGYMVRLAVQFFAKTEFDCEPDEMKKRVLRWGLGIENSLRELPSSFALKGEPGFTFNRIDIDIEDTPTPLFDRLCERIACNTESMKAFFWSVFEGRSTNQQYLWMYGEGGDGKGALMRLFERLLGDAYVGLSTDNPRWTADCIGKRLGVFNDITNTAFPMKSAVKQITGGDRVTTERKYQHAVSVRLDVKFVFTTNKPLSVSSQAADLRRCIYVKFGKNSDPQTPDYEDRIWEERAGILFKCRDAYQRLVGANGHIDCSDEALRDEVSDFEVQFEAIFARYFVEDKNCSIPRTEVFDAVRDSLNRDNFRYREFRQWLERVYGVMDTRMNMDGKRVYVLKGIRFQSKEEHMDGLTHEMV